MRRLRLSVVHAAWAGKGCEEVFVWVETQQEKETGMPCHPRNLEGKALARIIGAAYQEAAAHAGSAVLALPSAGGMPLPSPQLDGIVGRQGGAEGMREWKVEGVSLSCKEALEVFGAPRALLARLGAVPGDDFRFFCGAAEFILRLAANMKFLPSALTDGKAFSSRWIALMERDEDRVEMDSLSESMPPACCAGISGGLDAKRALEMFVGEGLDLFCRGAVTCSAQKDAAGEDSMNWALSLGRPSALIYGNRDSLVCHSIAEWSRRVADSYAGDFRLCFRLGEADGAGGFSLEALLQSRADPSLVAGVGNGGLAGRGERWDSILMRMGYASKLSPYVSRMLTAGSIGELALSPSEAYDFLSSAAMLVESGFGVMVPDWWKERRSLKAKISARPARGVAGAGMLGLDSLVEYEFKIVVDGREISRAEIEELLALNAPIARLNGKWIAVDRERARSALRLLGKKNVGTFSELMSEAAGGRELPVAEIEGEGWLGKLFGDKALEIKKEPDGFAGSLREYQKLGFSWLSHLTGFGFGCCLADDMGLGKTAQAIALVAERKNNARGGKRAPALVICPTSVVSNWMHEIDKFAPGLRVMVHHGSDRKRGRRFIMAAGRADVVISTYSLLSRDILHIRKLKWDGVILDEAQNIKNEQTKQSRNAKAIEAGYRIALTGTPMENRVTELKSVFDFINPGYLGSTESFVKGYAAPIQRDGDAAKMGSLRRMVGPFILRRLKTDRSIISDLPEKNEMKVYCSITREQAALYKATVEEMMEKIEGAQGIERRGNVLSAILRLKQILNHPAQFTKDLDIDSSRSGKMSRLEEMLDEAMASDDKILIFTQYVEMAKMLKEAVERRFGCDVLLLHGGVPRKERDLMVSDFQSESGARVFILSLKAGGTGLNLTAANRVFHYDRWWNPAVEDQATDRAFRIGQKRNVQVHKFVCSGTLDERIDLMLENKKDLMEKIVGASGEGWITELSNDALRKVFALRAEEIGE